MDKKLAKKFLFDVADILENEFNLPFFLADGTCLGAYRDKDFISWELDVDIKMMAEDMLPNCKMIYEALKRKGFDKGKIIMDTRHFNLPCTIELWKDDLALEIGALFLINKEYRWNIAPIPEHVYPRAWFEKPEWILFHGRRFRVPNPVEDYLKCLFGANYMTPLKPREWQRPARCLGRINIETKIEP